MKPGAAILGAIAIVGNRMSVPLGPRTRLVVVQPTSLCNLNCSYCYVPNRRDAARMSISTLEALFERVFTSPFIQDEVEVLWHAGEPMVVGLEFYRQAMRAIDKLNHNQLIVRHTLQTNATLVNEEWCELFSQFKFEVGVSIDGPAFLHDKYRKHWSGTGSHAETLKGYHLLQKNGISSGALCVLTSESLDHPAEIFRFFLSEGFKSVAFNIEERESANLTTSFDGEGVASLRHRYRKFISSFFEAHREHRAALIVREFSALSASIRSKRNDATFQRIPLEALDFGILTIQKNGDVSAFSPEFAGMTDPRYRSFVIGNIHHQDFGEMHSSSAYQVILSDTQLSMRMCEQSCRYFDFCGGAFFSNKVSEFGTLLCTETRSCQMHMQVLTDVLIEKLTGQPPEHSYDGRS